MLEQIPGVLLRLEFPRVVRLEILEPKFFSVANAIAFREVFEGMDMNEF